MSEDSHESGNTYSVPIEYAIVKWEPAPEIEWTLDDLRFLYACGVSCE